MKFEYASGARESLQRLLPDGISEFELSVLRSPANSEVDEIGVHLLTPGLSGAAVYLVTRISHGSKHHLLDNNIFGISGFGKS